MATVVHFVDSQCVLDEFRIVAHIVTSWFPIGSIVTFFHEHDHVATADSGNKDLLASIRRNGGHGGVGFFGFGALGSGAGLFEATF